MTDVSLRVKMPERVERAARKAGLLSGKFVRRAIERELDRRGAAARLARGVEKVRVAGFVPLTAAEVETEVHAARAARRMGRARRR